MTAIFKGFLLALGYVLSSLARIRLRLVGYVLSSLARIRRRFFLGCASDLSNA